MSAVRKLPEAEEDLLTIWLHIASDSPTNADRFLSFLDDKIHLLATSPGMGRLYPELGDGLRGFPVENYMIFYRAVELGIEIIRVIHGARDIESLF